MSRPATWHLVAAATLAWLLTVSPAPAQEGACDGVLEPGALDADADSAASLAAILAAVPKFGGTYVLVYSDANELGLAMPESSDASARVGVHAGSPAVAVAELTFGRPATARDYDPSSPATLVQAVLAGDLDAAVLWAPLAGLGAGQLDFSYALSLKTLGLPQAPPPYATGVVAATDHACADEIRGLLEGYGVISAEQLVPVDLETLLAEGPRPRLIHRAEEGLPLYELHCARCHGPEGIAATGALAPVDLVRSVQRFTWPGFLYIVLNGRQQNGMPGFRGSLEHAEIEWIYQYVRERAHGTIQPSAAALESAKTQVPPPTTADTGILPDNRR